MGKVEDYRKQIRDESNIPNTGSRKNREYDGRDLWLFYLSLKPMEIKRMQSKKGIVSAASIKKDVKSIQQGIFDALFNNSQYPFKAIGAANGKYEYMTITGGTKEALIKKCYDELIKSAKTEIQSEFSGLGKEALKLDISLSSSNAAGANGVIKNDLQKFLATTFQGVIDGIGDNYDSGGLLSNPRISQLANELKNNPKSSDELYNSMREAIIAVLFSTSSLRNTSVINSFKDSKEVTDIIKILKSKRRRQDIQMKLGLLAEDVVVAIAKHYASVMQDVDSELKAAIIKNIRKTGNIKESTSYPKTSGKEIIQITTKSFFITPDIEIEFSPPKKRGRKQEAKILKISLKTPSNLERVIYKSAKGKDEDKWTRIANWNKVLQTYAGFSVFNRAANAQFKLYQIFAAALSSLAVGGTAEHRALISVYISQGQLKIKSLDTILEEMRYLEEARLTMNQIRIRNQDAYIHNARRIASGRAMGSQDGKPYSTVDPRYIADEIYQKYSDLKELNLNYVLLTKAKK